MKRFHAYRGAAMASSTARIYHPTFGDNKQLRELLAAEWPEAAEADESAVLFREVGRGHQDGALCELMFVVGNDALGWRRFDQRRVDDATGWRWQAFPAECRHGRRERGKDVPRVYGSWRSQVCLDCGAFRTHGHNDDPDAPGAHANVSGWLPASEYAGATEPRGEDD